LRNAPRNEVRRRAAAHRAHRAAASPPLRGAFCTASSKQAEQREMRAPQAATQTRCAHRPKW
jgi:hypothetical protein